METVVTETYTDGVVSRRERVTYDYDATGIRVSAEHKVEVDHDGDPDTALELESHTKTEYLVDHHNFTGYEQVIKETHYDADTGDVTKTVEYTIGLDEIAQTTTEYASGLPSTVSSLVFGHDGHGSTRILTDEAGAIAESNGTPQIYHYDAYGNAIGFDPEAALTTLLYSGEQFDARIQQQYLRARYYDAATGRFNRLDPFAGNTRDPQSLHKYLYTHGDPVNGIDPKGLMSLSTVMARLGTFTTMVANGVKAAVAHPIRSILGSLTAAYFGTLWFGNTCRNQIAYTKTINLYVSALDTSQAATSEFASYRNYILSRADSIATATKNASQQKTTVNIIDGDMPAGTPNYDSSTKTLNIFVKWLNKGNALARGSEDKIEVLPLSFAEKLNELNSVGLNWFFGPFNGCFGVVVRVFRRRVSVA